MVKRYIFIAVAGVMFAAFGGVAQAHSYKKGDISIGHIWALPPDDDSVSVYGPLMNSGLSAEMLVAAESPVAQSVRFVAQDENGKTAEQDKIALEPQTPVSLAGWGIHIELYGVKQLLKDGDSFPLTFTFEKAGKVTVEVEVENEAGKLH